MKKTQLKDAIKNIQKQKVSFFSIAVIAAMAVAAFLGMNFASYAIARNADRFYDSANFRDAEVASTLLLSPEDIEALKKVEGVSDVEPVWQSSGVLAKGEQSRKATVVSLTSGINTPVILEGRLPQSAEECLVDAELAGKLSISAGDHVSITGADFLKVEQFNVCGIILTADYAANESAVPGNREVIVPKEAFDTAQLDECSMKALIRFDREAGLNRFYDPYFRAIDPAMERVEAIAGPQAAKRTEAVRNEYAEGIAEGEQKLKEAEDELKDARKKLDDGYLELADGEKEAEDAKLELENGATELENARLELEDGKARLLDGQEELKAAELELEDAKLQLDDGEKELKQAKRELEKGRKELDDGWDEYNENVALLAEAKEQLEAGKTELDDGEVKLADAKAELEDARKQLDDGWKEYHDNEDLLKDAKEQLDEGEAQLEEGDEKLQIAQEKLADARKQLDDGWKEYYENEDLLTTTKAQLEDGKKQLDDGEKELNAAAATLNSAWAELNAGEAQYTAAGEKLRNGAQAITDGEAELAQAKTTLTDGYAQLEDAKATVRNTIKQPLDEIFGGLTDSFINWAEDEESIDADDPSATATLLPITKEITIDLNKSLAGNAADIISLMISRGVTEEEIVTAVETARGVIDLLPDESLISAIARKLEGEFAEYNEQYEILASSAHTWDAGHDDYIAGTEKVAAAKAEYASGLSEYNSARVTLDYGWRSYYSGSAEYSAGYSEFVSKKSQYEDGLAKYNEGVEKLAEGLKTLQDGEKEYEEGLVEYETGAEELETARELFNEKLAEYNDGEKQLAEGLLRLDEGEAEYADGLAAYEDGAAELEEAGKLYEEKLAEYYDGEAKLADGLAKLEEGETEYAEGLKKYNNGRKSFEESQKLYLDGRAEYEEAVETFLSKSDEYSTGRRKYEESLAAYHNGMRQYDDGLKEIARARKELADGEEKYSSGLEEYEEGVRKLEDTRKEMADLAECRWLVLDPDGNASYQIIKGAVGNVSDMGMTFAMIFILVGALVIYTTLGRIVEEQRRIIGATRALGLYKREILSKYLFYGVSATVIGMLIGIALGYFLIQPILTVNYGQFYNFSNKDFAFVLRLTVFVLLGGIALSVVAVWSACTELVRSSATSLMQEKVPPTKHKPGKWTEKMSLYSKLIIMNIKTDMKRVIVTIVSVAGSCALLMAGFSMRNGIIEAIRREFNEKTLYNYSVLFVEEDETAQNIRNTMDELEDIGAGAIGIRNENVLLTYNGEISSGILMCGDMNEIDEVFPFWSKYDIKMPVDAEGVYIGCKLAENYNLSAGDTITILDANMLPCDVKVAGIFLNYIGRQMAMSRETYKAVFNAEPKDNTLLVSDRSADPAVVRAKLDSADGTVNVQTTGAVYEDAMKMASVLNLIAILMIAISGIMSGFILLNIINMHISQKKKELTIMRINGFTVREVIAYIARETVVTNIIGIITGVGIGIYLGYRILHLIEGKTSFFVHEPLPWTIILSVVITAGFSVILNTIALKKVKYLKLTDI